MKNVLVRLTLLLTLSACGGSPGSGPAPGPPPQQTPSPTPVGTPSGSVIQQVIGAAGGTLGTPDGSFRVAIPAGALAAEHTIGLQPITRTAPGGTGTAYRLTPGGLTFTRPVTITARYRDEDVVGSAAEALSLGFQDVSGVWRRFRTPTRDLAARTVSVETTHFSDWSLLAGVQLLPRTAEIDVGTPLKLQVVSCVLPEGGEPGELTTATECGPAAAAFTARGWAANGVAGGHAGVGTVADTGVRQGAAIYTAPARVPGQNPVAVSATVSDLTLGTVTVVANVKVREPANAWQGRVFYTETGQRAWKMNDGFEGSGTEFAKQTHVFRVVGARPVDALNTILLLEQEATVEYSDTGHMEKKIFDICEAFGPTILRHHFIYDRQFSMTGRLTATVEARLHIEDGEYSLAFSPQDVPVTGQDRTIDVYRDGCAGTTNDRSNTRTVRTTEGPLTTAVEGRLDPARPGVLKGEREGRSEVFVQPTQYLLTWELTRGP